MTTNHEIPERVNPCQLGGRPRPFQVKQRTGDGALRVYGWAAGCTCGWQGKVYPLTLGAYARPDGLIDRGVEARRRAEEHSRRHAEPAPRCDLCYIHHSPEQCSGLPPLPFS